MVGWRGGREDDIIICLNTAVIRRVEMDARKKKTDLPIANTRVPLSLDSHIHIDQSTTSMTFISPAKPFRQLKENAAAAGF